MKYFVLETTMVRGAYKNPGFQEALAGHMGFVKEQFAQGIILFSGTKPDNSGGIRVLKIADEENVETYWKLDPMTQAGMLEYKVAAFTPLDCFEGTETWFK